MDDYKSQLVLKSMTEPAAAKMVKYKKVREKSTKKRSKLSKKFFQRRRENHQN
jgi:hypothetical protein